MAYGYDNTLAAYLRQMGVSEQNVLSEARQRNALSNRQYLRTVPGWDEQKRQAGVKVDGDYEASGMFQSGARVRDRGIAIADIARGQLESQAAGADTRVMNDMDANRRIAEMRQGAAEETLASRTRMAVSGAQSAYGSR